MTKSYTQKNKWFATKRCGLLLLSILLIVCVLASSFSIFLSTFGQLTKVAGSETQFKIDIAYAYVGEWKANTSYTDSQDHQVSLVSLYPSVVMLNITKLPGVRITSCDAIFEVYDVDIRTDSGQFEKFAYGIGTNYSSTFTAANVQSFIPYMHQLVDRNIYRGGYEGTLWLNWTENTSMMTNGFGSACIYSSYNSTTGLWKAGTPNTISVTVNRVGYLTISNDSVSVYKDALTTPTVAVQLSNFEEGFLHNSIIPSNKLNETNLFTPEAQNQANP